MCLILEIFVIVEKTESIDFINTFPFLKEISAVPSTMAQWLKFLPYKC